MIATWNELEDHQALEERWGGRTLYLLNEEASGLSGQVELEASLEWFGDEPMVTLTWVDATDSGTEVFYGLADEADAWWAGLERTLEGEGGSLAGTLDYLRDGAAEVGRCDAAGLGDRWRGWQIVRSARIWGYGRG